MEIEIYKSKHKLTKSMINQMRIAPNVALKDGNPLGYINKVVKGISRAILIEYQGEYYIYSSAWEKGTNSNAVYRTVGRWSQTQKFNSEQELHNWWRIYLQVKSIANKQIYI